MLRTGEDIRTSRSAYFELIERLKPYFPDLKPIKRPPPLHGGKLGLTTVGRRDPEKQFDTYVTTVVVSYDAIPLFAVGAFRVRDAAMGAGRFISLNLNTSSDDRTAITQLCPVKANLHFIGQEPLSAFARTMDSLVILALLLLLILIVKSS
jgi:hypothetical protein